MLTAVAAVAITFGIILYVALDNVRERRSVRDALRRISEFEFDNARQRDMLTPLRARAIAPVLTRIVELSRRLTPNGYAAAARRKLTLAGRPSQTTIDGYMAARLITAAFIPVVLLWFAIAAPVDGALGLASMCLVLLVLALGPDAIVKRWVDERQHAIQRALPDTLDLLCISVEAGLGFDQAIDRTIVRTPGPLADEFARMLGEVRAGIDRAEALRGLDERTQVPELASFVLAIIQADAFGISIGRVLRSQAEEMRIKRRQLAQERAQKAPVKMLFPMMLCIFPMIFVIVLGPGVMNLYDQFIGK